MLIEFHHRFPEKGLEFLMDKALKQRMVGASVLIALAVIVLPMLLGGRPEGENQQTRKIELPAQPPELSFETRRYPIGEQDPEQQAKTGRIHHRMNRSASCLYRSSRSWPA